MIDGDDPVGALLLAEIHRGATPGAAWWVGGARGPVSSGHAGSASLEPELAPVLATTPFDLASLTKPLATAPLAAMLDGGGALSLDTKLGVAFPELSGSPFRAATLRDAAAHRAGFPPWIPLYLQGATPAAYLAAIAGCTPAARPGETLYSDLGYILLGFALERSTGTPLDRLFDQRIAQPLGLARCGFAGVAHPFGDAAATERRRAYEEVLAGPSAPAERFQAPIPRGQVHDGNAWGLGGTAGHAGLFATAAEVAGIALAILDPVRLGLDPHAFDAMLRPVAAGGGARSVGFLRAADADSVRGLLPDTSVGHSGFTGTSVWIDPARGRVYVLLTNRVHPSVPSESFTGTRRAFHATASAIP